MRSHLVVTLVAGNIESPGARDGLIESFYCSSRGTD
jgi:hypothetical protein